MLGSTNTKDISHWTLWKRQNKRSN